MVSLCFYFQVHQPYRIKRHSIFDIGTSNDYFSDKSDCDLNNEKVLKKVSQKCYLPTNKLMLGLIKRHPKFKISYSLSGTAIDQFEEFAPDVLNSFQDLTDTGNVEILDETYHHSLSFLYSKDEFRKQVLKHRIKVKKLFNQEPNVFRNTELIFNNDLAKEVENMGYKGILAEGADHILGWKSPNFVYKPKTTQNIKLLLKNYRLSDDIAFRFSEKNWSGWPLTSEKFAAWVNSHNGNGELINLFMDYETFGEHQWHDTGIFHFLENLPKEILKHPDNIFKTPSEVISSHNPVGELDIHDFISWADVDRDLSAWLGNSMQSFALNAIYRLKDEILSSDDPKLIEDWRRLQTSDHFYYMCTKWFSDGDVHKYFNPYETPYDAFITFMNVLNDLKHRLKQKNKRITIQ
jgi:alpha-amylase